MLATPHILAGAAVGSAVTNYPASIILPILLHYILDAIPHYDQAVEGPPNTTEYIIAAIDIIFGFSIIFLIIKYYDISEWKYLAVGAFSGLIPDFIDNLPIISPLIHKIKIFNKIYEFHRKIQYLSKRKTLKFIGIASQIIMVIIALLIILRG